MKLGAIGECMLELTHTDPLKLSMTSLGFGGDTLNTLIYASRLGLQSYFFSALGQDSYSHWLLEQWSNEKINIDFVTQYANKLPGMYAIQVDSVGERRFFYWREQSAAKEFIKRSDPKELLKHLTQMDVIYFSGISLAILDDEQRYTLLNIIKALKQSNKIIVFDGNFRPKNWKSVEQARFWSDQFLAYVDWYLPTFEDEQALFAVKTVEELIEHHSHYNIPEIALKDGENGCWLISDGKRKQVAIPLVVTPIDTTAAGDSFNAGYITARIMLQKWGILLQEM